MPAPNESLQTPATGQLDPSLPDWRHSVDPTILAIVTDPDTLNPQERQLAVKEATKQAAWGEKIIVSDEKGEPRWGNEINNPGDVFSFKGTIRAAMDGVSDDPMERNANGQDRFPDDYLRGTATHLIIETDDGQQLMIRRTTETRAGENQTFDIASTSKGGRRDIDSSMLKDVVAMVGEPLVLGADPKTGTRLRTRGAITKITTMDMTKDPVAANHPRLGKPEFQRDTVQRFGEAMRAARTQEVAPVVGEDAVGQEVVLLDGNGENAAENAAPQQAAAATPEQAAPDTTNPYERFTSEQLEQIRDNIAGSVVSGIRRYDHAEVARASANLAAIQREFQARFPDKRPQFERGTEDNGVLYVTEPDQQIVEKIAHQLQAIDGGYGIAAAIYGGLETSNEDDREARLADVEEFVLLDKVVKVMRAEAGTQIDAVRNPYSIRTNGDLAKTVSQLKETISDLAAKSQDTTQFVQNLALAGAVIKSREVT